MNEQADIEYHLKSFAEAFVLDMHKDKWLNLLSKRPEDLWKNSPKFFNHLDHRYIEQDNSLSDVASLDTSGVFYDFKHEPKRITF